MATPQRTDWEIVIKAPFKGLAPKYYKNTKSTYGDAKQWNYLKDVDLSDLNCIKQGPAFSDYTVVNSDNSNTYEKIVDIIDFEIRTGKTYAISATYIWEVNNTNHTMTMIHKLPNGVGASGESIAYHNNKIYYIYNKTTLSEIGQWDMSSTWNDTWGTSQPLTPTNIFTKGKHPICESDSFMVIGNGRYLGLYDNLSLQMNSSDFLEGSEIQDIITSQHKTYVLANTLVGAFVMIYSNDFSYQNDDGTPKVFGPDDSIPVGDIGYNLFANNGVVYITHKNKSDDAYSVGYINGSTVSDVFTFSGVGPTYQQKTWYNGFLTWINDNGLTTSSLVQLGSQDVGLSLITNNYTSQSKSCCVASPFGNLLLATDTKLKYSNGLSIASSAKTLDFEINRLNRPGYIDTITVRTNSLASDAKCDLWINMTDEEGNTTREKLLREGTTNTIFGTGITYHQFTNTGFHKIVDFQIEPDWSVGSTINNCELREVYITGHS